MLNDQSAETGQISANWGNHAQRIHGIMDTRLLHNNEIIISKEGMTDCPYEISICILHGITLVDLFSPDSVKR